MIGSVTAPVIITGGPGGGKSTLLAELATLGFVTFAEVPRQLIEAQSQIPDGILPWDNLPGFAALCLQTMEGQKRIAATVSGPVFLDRAIGDICAYLNWGGHQVSEAYRSASLGYHPQVFFCTLHPDFYVRDAVRPYPFAEAQVLHEQLLFAYQALGYHCIEVPWGTPGERSRFVLSHLEAGWSAQSG